MPKSLKQYLFKYSDNFTFDENLIESASGVLRLSNAYSTAYDYCNLNPSIATKKSIPLTAINSFVPIVTEPTGTAVQYTLIKDGQDYYYHSGWVVSNGSYSQSNTLAEIQANLSTFTTERTRVKIRIFLNSNGTATPSISSLNFGFDYTGYCTPDDVRALMGHIGSTSGIDDEDLIGVIEIADDQINSYLGEYTLPFTSTPSQIKSYSAVIAAYNLHSNLETTEGGTTKSPQRVRYEQAISELEDISKGKKVIFGLTKTDKIISYSSSETVVEANEPVIMFENYSG